MGRHGGGNDDEWEVTEPVGLEGLFAEAADHQADGEETTPSPHVRAKRGWGYRALVLVFVLAAAVIGFRIAGVMQQHDDGELLVPAASANASRSGGASAVASSGAEAASTGAVATAAPGRGAAASVAAGAAVQVHVVGAVRRPGLYRLGTGARIADAVEEAGGATGKADLAAVNLAQPLTDGVQVRIPARGESPTAAAGTGGGSGDSAEGGSTTGTGAVGGADAVVNLNSADEAALQTLPGIGPALSQRLIDWREQHGPFGSASDLDAVPGIGPAMLAKLEGLVGYG